MLDWVPWSWKGTSRKILRLMLLNLILFLEFVTNNLGTLLDGSRKRTVLKVKVWEERMASHFITVS